MLAHSEGSASTTYEFPQAHKIVQAGLRAASKPQLAELF